MKIENLIKEIINTNNNILIFGAIGIGKNNTIVKTLKSLDENFITIRCNLVYSDEIEEIISEHKDYVIIFEDIDKAHIDVQNKCFIYGFEREKSNIFVSENIDNFDDIILNKLMIFDYNEIINIKNN